MNDRIGWKLVRKWWWCLRGLRYVFMSNVEKEWMVIMCNVWMMYDVELYLLGILVKRILLSDTAEDSAEATVSAEEVFLRK